MRPGGKVSDTIFVFDAGNTRIKWGVHDGRAYAASGAIETASAARVDPVLPAGARAQRAIASNVAGADGTVQSLTRGQAAVWEPGESHETRSADGLTAMIVEGDLDIGAPGEQVDPGDV